MSERTKMRLMFAGMLLLPVITGFLCRNTLII